MHETTRYGISPLSWCAQPVTRALQFAAVLTMLFAMAVTTPAISKAAADGQCADVEVIFARGTMEPPGPGTVGQQFSDALTSRLGGNSVDVYPVNYPASLNFSQAGDGVADAANRVIDIVNTCPATKIVLGGYSQGAAIAAYITSDSVPARLRTPRGHHRPFATQRRPARRGRHPVRQALQRVSQPDRPRRPADQHRAALRTQDARPVHTQDPVCSSGQGFSPAAHSAYKTNGMTDQAADFAANAIHGR